MLKIVKKRITKTVKITKFCNNIQNLDKIFNSDPSNYVHKCTSASKPRIMHQKL